VNGTRYRANPVGWSGGEVAPKDHDILTRVAGHGSHIKLLPPDTITQEDCT
jgi:hypothetical protein